MLLKDPSKFHQHILDYPGFASIFHVTCVRARVPAYMCEHVRVYASTCVRVCVRECVRACVHIGDSVHLLLDKRSFFVAFIFLSA